MIVLHWNELIYPVHFEILRKHGQTQQTHKSNRQTMGYFVQYLALKHYGGRGNNKSRYDNFI